MRERIEDVLERYGVSPRHGFLPDQLPLERLPGPHYEPWESLISQLPQLVADDQARSNIDRLPEFDTESLCSRPEWHRAYVVFGFLTHAYIWGGEEPSQVRLKHEPCFPVLLTCA
jgi:indoleamine 2,3-dioxygenase